MEKPKYEVPKELIIPASEHPKAFEGPTLILNIIMCALGAIIGLELIVRTGVTPNTSIIGALFAIVLSRIPRYSHRCKRWSSHESCSQNLVRHGNHYNSSLQSPK